MVFLVNNFLIFSNFTASLNTLWTEMGVDEPRTKETFEQISDSLAQVVHLNKQLIEHTFPAFRSNLDAFNQK